MKRKSFVKLTTAVLFLILSFSSFAGCADIFDFSKIKYLDSYVTTEGTYASVKILDDESVALTIEDKVYVCNLEEKSSDDFTITPLIKNIDDSLQSVAPLSLKFNEDTATVNGQIGESLIDFTMKTTKDIELSFGIWQMFGRDNLDGTFEESDGMNWIALFEDGEAYAGEGYMAWKSEFVPVGDKIVHYIRDQVSGIAQVSLVEVLPSSVFGFPVIKDILYEYEGDLDPFVPYYRLLDESETYNFNGGTFNGNIVLSEGDAEQIKKSDLYAYDDINWLLRPKYGYEQQKIDCNIRLDLHSDGTLNADFNAGFFNRVKTDGKWCRLKECILIIVDKKVLSTKAFVIHAEEEFNEDILVSGVTDIETIDLYKVGFFKFDYYMFQAQTTIYWGRGWTDEVISPTLVYNKEYILDARMDKEYYENLYKCEVSEEQLTNGKIEFIENGQVGLTFFEDGTGECRYGENIVSFDYDLNEYDAGRFEVIINNYMFLDVDEEHEYRTSRTLTLLVGVNKIYQISELYKTVNNRTSPTGKKFELIFKLKY